jgi:hypothetical protein
MAHGGEREEKWRGNKRMEWVTSKRHVTAEHRLARAVQTLQAEVHSSPASSRLNWRPCRFKWTRPFRRKMKSGFCACGITFQTQSTNKRNSLRSGKNEARILVLKIVLTALRCLCKAVANNDYWPHHVCASILPTVYIERRKCHRSVFREISCLIFLLNFVDIRRFRFKSDTGNKHFTPRPTYILIISRLDWFS